MHGPACEDGSIQGLLEWYGVPYSGPSLMGSSIGIDKIAQNDLIRLAVGLDKKQPVSAVNILKVKMLLNFLKK